MSDQVITDRDEATTPAVGDKGFLRDISDTTDDATGTDKWVTLQRITDLFKSLAQTLTNKTIDADNNTISNIEHGAEADEPSSGTHGVTGSVVGTTDSQTLTNKTLTSPVVNTPTGIVKGDVGLGNVDNTSNATERAATATHTNKRITKRVTTIVSHATPTVDTDDCDVVTITAQGEAITSMTTNLSGTETNFQTLIFRILDDGTGRAITWGAAFEPRGVALPTTTTANKLLTVGFIYDTVDDIWGCVASADET